MGDHVDAMDVERFMRSREGKRYMAKFRKSVVGKQVVGVSFANNTSGVGITLLFEGGDFIDIGLAVEAFAVGSLRERYARALDREYRRDYPDRITPSD
jgi:hypothetical protein